MRAFLGPQRVLLLYVGKISDNSTAEKPILGIASG
jgi:hypothetical protein